MMLKVGEKVPEFQLPDENNTARDIKEFYADNFLVLYFYPMDFTPGCTKEACSFRDNFQFFSDQGVNVVGISSDSTDRHLKFKEKHNLPFTLLSDRKNRIRKLFGLKGLMFGVIPQRVTFVIDPKGEIIHIFDKLLAYSVHAEAAIEIIQQHRSKSGNNLT